MFLSRFKPQLIKVGSIVIFFIVVIATIKEFNRYRQVRLEKIKLEQSIITLESKKKTLEQTLAEIKSPFFLERQAREQLNLKKEGENVVVIPLENASVQGWSASGGNATNNPNNKGAVKQGNKETKEHWWGNVVEWWGYFFDV